MSDANEKMIDFYERSRDEVISPFSREYDDMPWQARVDMARNSQWLDRSQNQQRGEPIDAEFKERETIGIVGALLVGSAIGLGAILLWVSGYVIWDVWTSDRGFTEKLIVGAGMPLAFVFVICMLIVIEEEEED
jgi:hypothetical protein